MATKRTEKLVSQTLDSVQAICGRDYYSTKQKNIEIAKDRVEELVRAVTALPVGPLDEAGRGTVSAMVQKAVENISPVVEKTDEDGKRSMKEKPIARTNQQRQQLLDWEERCTEAGKTFEAKLAILAAARKAADGITNEVAAKACYTLLYNSLDGERLAKNVRSLLDWMEQTASNIALAESDDPTATSARHPILLYSSYDRSTGARIGGNGKGVMINDILTVLEGITGQRSAGQLPVTRFSSPIFSTHLFVYHDDFVFPTNPEAVATLKTLTACTTYINERKCMDPVALPVHANLIATTNQHLDCEDDLALKSRILTIETDGRLNLRTHGRELMAEYGDYIPDVRKEKGVFGRAFLTLLGIALDGERFADFRRYIEGRADAAAEADMESGSANQRLASVTAIARERGVSDILLRRILSAVVKAHQARQTALGALSVVRLSIPQSIRPLFEGRRTLPVSNATIARIINASVALEDGCDHIVDPSNAHRTFACGDYIVDSVNDILSAMDDEDEQSSHAVAIVRVYETLCGGSEPDGNGPKARKTEEEEKAPEVTEEAEEADVERFSDIPQPTHAFIRWGRTAKVPTVAVPVTDKRAKGAELETVNPYDPTKMEESVKGGSKYGCTTSALASMRNMVFEVDEGMTLEEQTDLAKDMVRRGFANRAVFSGHKSVHVRMTVDIEPESVEEYKFIWDRINQLHFSGKADRQCAEPNRKTRRPGGVRDGVEQTLICEGDGVFAVPREWIDAWRASKATAERTASLAVRIPSEMTGAGKACGFRAVTRYLSNVYRLKGNGGASQNGLLSAISVCKRYGDETTLEKVLEKARAEGWTERELNHKLEDARA